MPQSWFRVALKWLMVQVTAGHRARDRSPPLVLDLVDDGGEESFPGESDFERTLPPGCIGSKTYKWLAHPKPFKLVSASSRPYSLPSNQEAVSALDL